MNRSIWIGDWLLTPASHRLSRDETTHVLRPKLVAILECLTSEPGRVLQRDEMLERIWPGIVVTDDSLTRGISELRKLLGDSAETPRYIETIRKGGYRWIATVRPAEPRTPVRSHRSLWPRWPLRPLRARRIWTAAAAAAAILVIAIASTRDANTTSPPASSAPSARSAFAAAPEPRPLTTLIGRETDPAVAPGGERVAFAWNGPNGDNYDIYVKQLDRDELQRVTEDPAADIHPAWSPDGRRVAFLRISEQSSGIYVAPSNGGSPELAVAAPPILQGLDWGPDGSSLVYATRANGSSGLSIHLFSLADRTGAQISEPPAQSTDHSPVFSPDGLRIAYVRSALRSHHDRIVFASLDGQESRSVDVGDLPLRGIEWVADPHHVILAAEVTGSARLFRMRVADGALDPIPLFEERVTYPSLSADGRTLVYEDERPRGRLHRVSLAGSADAPQLEAILATTHTDRDADYAPDGERLAFVSNRSGPFELWVADRDGRHAERLTDSGSCGVESPRWSPSGDRIAFLRTGAGAAEVWVATSTGAAQRVRKLHGEAVLSGWSHDGTALYVSSDGAGAWECARVRVEDGTAEPLAIAGAIVAHESPDGHWLYYSRADEGGIWRAPLANGEATSSDGSTAELVLPSFQSGFAESWSLSPRGLVFTEWRDLELRVSLLELDTRKTTPLLQARWSHHPGFALSPRGDELVLSTVDSDGSDLNVVEDMTLF